MRKCILSYKQPVYKQILVRKSICKLGIKYIHVSIRVHVKCEFGYKVIGHWLSSSNNLNSHLLSWVDQRHVRMWLSVIYSLLQTPLSWSILLWFGGQHRPAKILSSINFQWSNMFYENKNFWTPFNALWWNFIFLCIRKYAISNICLERMQRLLPI